MIPPQDPQDNIPNSGDDKNSWKRWFAKQLKDFIEFLMYILWIS